MLSPQQFKEDWEAEVVAKDSLPDDVRLLVVPVERLTSLRLTEAARHHLAEAGLPKACAPCLTFDEIEKGLPRLWDVFSPGSW